MNDDQQPRTNSVFGTYDDYRSSQALSNGPSSSDTPQLSDSANTMSNVTALPNSGAAAPTSVSRPLNVYETKKPTAPTSAVAVILTVLCPLIGICYIAAKRGEWLKRIWVRIILVMVSVFWCMLIATAIADVIDASYSQTPDEIEYSEPVIITENRDGATNATVDDDAGNTLVDDLGDDNE